MLPRNRARRWA